MKRETVQKYLALVIGNARTSAATIQIVTGKDCGTGGATTVCAA